MARRWRALNRKYAQLVDKLESRRHEDTSLFQLASWVLKTSDTALALVRDGQVAVGNRAWTALAASGGPSHALVRLDAEGAPYGPSFPDLWSLVRSELGRPRASATSSSASATSSASAAAASDPLQRRYRRADGEVLELRFDPSLGRGSDATFVMIVPVTEHVRREKELEALREERHHQQRLQALGRTVAGIAHDLNSSLFAVRLNLEALLRDHEGPRAEATLKRLLAAVDDGANRIAALSQFAKQSKEQGAFEAVDLLDVVQYAVAVADAGFEEETVTGKEKRPSVVVSIPKLPAVRGRPGELRPMFVNLLLNARDAMPEGGRIEIVAERSGEKVVVEVRDEGSGIPPEALPHVFEPFFTSKGEQGSGLGLALAYSTMRRLGGKISAQNRRGKGAVFTLEFPLAERALLVDRKRPFRSGRVSAKGGRRRILVVDDDALHREGMQDCLRAHDVDVADGGASALAMLRHDRGYELVISDLNMSPMTGWRLAELLRKDYPELKLMLLSGWTDSIARDDPRRKLADEMLAKPVAVEQLEAAIERLLAPKRGGHKAATTARRPSKKRVSRSR